MGTYLHERLRDLRKQFPIIGDVRGRGLLAGIEFVRDRAKREPWPQKWFVAQEATEIAREHGLLIYPRRSLYGLWGDHILICPPLIIDQQGIDELVELFERTLIDLTKLLDRFLVKEARTEDEEQVIERFEVPEKAPAYALGDIEGIELDTDANVTADMEGGQIEVKSADTFEEMDYRQ